MTSTDTGQTDISQIDISSLAWKKSSFSNNTCVEAAGLGDGRVAVRNSRKPAAGFIVYETAEWQAFLAGVRNGEFDDLDAVR